MSDILSFSLRDSDLKALLEAERASRSIISSVDSDTDLNEALSLLRSCSNLLENALENFRRRTSCITALREERAHAILAVARLNPDVLCLVFTFVTDIEGRPRYPRKNTWVRLGHVCRQWRGTLLGAVHLWARDLFAFPKAFEHILPRTLDAPLDLALYEHGKWRTDKNFLDVGLPLLNRARLLVCYPTSPDDTLRIAESLRASPARHLEEIRIILNSNRSTSFGIPHIQLAQHSNLRRLSMIDIFLRPTFCNALVALEIFLEEYALDMMPSSSTLLDILSMSSRLQTFTLLGWVEIPGASTQTTPGVSITMAELTKLKLQLGSRERNHLSPQGGLQSFVASLKMPALVQADITEFAWPDEILAFETTLNTTFTACAGSPCIDHYARLTVAHGLADEDRNLLQMELSEFRKHPSQGRHLRVSLQASEDTELEDMVLRVSTLNGVLHAHGIAPRVKCIDWRAHEEVSYSYTYWQAAFAGLDSAEMIYLCEAEHCNPCALTESPLLLAALRGIILDDQYLKDVNMRFPGLLEILTSRKAIGAPIRMLGVEGVDIVAEEPVNYRHVAITDLAKAVGATVDFPTVYEDTSEWGECGTSVRFTYCEDEG